MKNVTWYDAARLPEQIRRAQGTCCFAFRIKEGPTRQNAKSAITLVGDPLTARLATLSRVAPAQST